MAFTAGSPELAKAERLGNQLASIHAQFGSAGVAGQTGARKVEKYAKKLGFGLVGITSGSGFPTFASIGGRTASRLALETGLQNTAGLTQPNGITVPSNFAIEGQTVGIYLKKYVRVGDAPSGVTAGSLNKGVTAGVVSGTTFESFVFAPGNSQYLGLTAMIYYSSSASGITYKVQ